MSGDIILDNDENNTDNYCPAIELGVDYIHKKSAREENVLGQIDLNMNKVANNECLENIQKNENVNHEKQDPGRILNIQIFDEETVLDIKRALNKKDQAVNIMKVSVGGQSNSSILTGVDLIYKEQ